MKHAVTLSGLGTLGLFLLPLVSLAQTASPEQSGGTTSHADWAVELKACLDSAYPGMVCGVEEDALALCRGGSISLPDPAQPRAHREALKSGDLYTQLAQVYPVGGPGVGPGEDFDPGRVRDEAFFRAMYGSSASEVRQRTRRIRWMPGTAGGGTSIRVSTMWGVDAKLEAIARELESLPPKSARVAAVTAGAFHWREIRGTSRLSPHSFGIAIDLGGTRADYWRWRRGKDGRPGPWRNRIPMEIVRVFEAHGFAWGGRWYHFDTMHFEYRPELFAAPCRALSRRLTAARATTEATGSPFDPVAIPRSAAPGPVEARPRDEAPERPEQAPAPQ